MAACLQERGGLLLDRVAAKAFSRQVDCPRRFSEMVGALCTLRRSISHVDERG